MLNGPFTNVKSQVSLYWQMRIDVLYLHWYVVFFHLSQNVWIILNEKCDMNVLFYMKDSPDTSFISQIAHV